MDLGMMGTGQLPMLALATEGRSLALAVEKALRMLAVESHFPTFHHGLARNRYQQVPGVGHEYMSRPGLPQSYFCLTFKGWSGGICMIG